MTTRAVVTPHLLSAEAGRHTLLQGGNAVDAAIAMVLAQGVVAPETCGVGGDLFALIMKPGWEKPIALNASGRAGSKADPNRLRSLGHTAIPRDDPLTATIPGCVDGVAELSQRLGQIPLKQSAEPAVTLANEGFTASDEQSRAFTAMADVYRDNPAVAPFYPSGNPIETGARVQRPNLARTIQDLAAGGRDAFYSGQPGREIQQVLNDHVTPDDLEQKLAEWVEPLACPIGDQIAWTIPPNSAGYLGPATLAVFLRLDPPDDPDDPLWWHLMVESHRALAWERERLVADPSTAVMEADEMVSSDRLDSVAATVAHDRVGTWPMQPSQPTGTAFMCVRDESGMAVSIINSNYRGTGSPFGAPESGFLLHDRGAGFSLVPGHPNELNPGKRPAHTLSPTLWTSGDQPSWVLGTRGGEIQPQLIAQLAARAIVGGQELDRAQSAARWSMTEYEAGSSSTVSLEPGSGVAEALRRLGHNVIESNEMQPGWGPMSIIDCNGPIRAAADPRVDTTAALVF